MPILRTRFLLPILAILSAVLVLAACSEPTPTPQPTATPAPTLPSTTAASVLDYLEKVNYQETWQLWPGKGEKYQGDEPHGMLLTTYLNPAAFDALDGKKGVMPDGAIIVKENYTPEGVYDANTVMYKKSGYNPDHNDWFWLKVLADGTVAKEGMVEGCQMCHGDAKDNDYVWTGPLN